MEYSCENSGSSLTEQVREFMVSIDHALWPVRALNGRMWECYVDYR